MVELQPVQQRGPNISIMGPQPMYNGKRSEPITCKKGDGFTTYKFKLPSIFTRLSRLIVHSRLHINSDGEGRFMAGTDELHLHRLEYKPSPSNGKVYVSHLQLTTWEVLKFLLVGRIIVKYQTGAERPTNVSL